MYELRTNDPSFDCQNLEQFAGDIPCPIIDESVMHNYIRYGEEDRWGKRRETRAHVERYVRDTMERLLPISETHQRPQRSVSLNIRGAGGGQWTLHWLPSGELAVEAGLLPRKPST